MIQIRVEKLSGHGKEGKVCKIYVSVGDEVNKGTPLFEIESNKGNMTIEASGNGKIEGIEVVEGSTVQVGDLLASMTGEQTSEGAANSKSAFNYMAGMLQPQKKEIESDITIIGGGPGGYVAAIQAAMLGAKVVLIEKDSVGGTCLNWGCIPTKALIRSAEVYKTIREADKFGINVENISIDMKKVIKRKNDIINQLVDGIEYLIDKHNILLIKGFGKILDENTVLAVNARSETTVRTKNIIIATGSKTINLPVSGIDSKNVITSKEALNMESLPKKLVIVGGGVIGMEFAFMYSNLGVDVSVIEYFDSVLATLDQDISQEISQIAKGKGIKLYTGAKIQEILETHDGECIIVFKKDEKTNYITAEKVLLAVGRAPVTEGIGIENLKIDPNDNRKGIKVNDKLQTSISNIYAIGDVTDRLQLAHVASHQGIIAVKNILGHDIKMNYDVIPSAIFTDPEIATVGIDEKTAKEKGFNITVGKFPIAANGKALTLGEGLGFVKIIKENSSGKIIGGAIIGPHATDMIAEITLAIKNELSTEQIIETIHAHPTTAEAVYEAALSIEGGAIHFIS